MFHLFTAIQSTHFSSTWKWDCGCTVNVKVWQYVSVTVYWIMSPIYHKLMLCFFPLHSIRNVYISSAWRWCIVPWMSAVYSAGQSLISTRLIVFFLTSEWIAVYNRLWPFHIQYSVLRIIHVCHSCHKPNTNMWLGSLCAYMHTQCQVCRRKHLQMFSLMCPMDML
jgi:hypothetical protein